MSAGDSLPVVMGGRLPSICHTAAAEPLNNQQSHGRGWSPHRRRGDRRYARVAQMQDFRWVLDQIESGNIRAERMITDVSDFAHAKESFEEWVSCGGAVFKGIIEVE